MAKVFPCGLFVKVLPLLKNVYSLILQYSQWSLRVGRLLLKEKLRQTVELFLFINEGTEVNTYRLYSQQKHTTPTVSIDATGSVVRKLTLPTGRHSGHIFLYEITVCDPVHGVLYNK